MYTQIIKYRVDDIGPGDFEIIRHLSRPGFAGEVDTIAKCYTQEDADLIVKALTSYKEGR